MNSDPIVMRYVGDGSIRSHEQMLEELEMLMSYYTKRPGLGVWAIELKTVSKFIGAGGLTYNTGKAAVELGYRLLNEQWGKGYATEASSGLLRYAFRNMKVSKLIASAHCENLASHNVLKKIGMSHIGNGFEFDSPQVYYEIDAKDFI
jgi:RimJ/RimL family protein N-acetyltransferase